MLRLLTAQIGLPVFDIDPLLAPGGQPGLTPGASLILDGVVLLAAALGLFGEWRAGARIHLWTVGASLLPVLTLLPRLGGPIDDLWRGATWTSSVVAGVVLAHLLRDAALRRLALAILLGALAVVAVRGAGQILVEHPRMVEAFSSLRPDLLADRGWQDGSASTRVFEDRLRQREATGWFGLSNVFSSTMVVACLAAAGVALGAWRRSERPAVAARRPLQSGPRAAPTHGLRPAGVPVAALAMGALALLLLNGSKGAIASLALGAVVGALGASAGERWTARRGFKLVLLLAWGLPLLAVGAVLLRGLLLPEAFAGERSVLFRWHYLVDAGNVLARHPVLGVGPAGFQQAMVAVRPPHHAEEVVSAHNVAADWLVALGILGVAWVAVLAILLRWASLAVVNGSGAVSEEADAATARPSTEAAGRARPAILSLLLVACLAVWMESATLDVTLLALRVAGLAAGLAVAAGAVGVLAERRGDATSFAASSIRWGLFAAAVALVVHAQIEMTFFLQGAVPWAMATLALAGPAPVQPRASRRSALAPLACLAMVAGGTGATALGWMAAGTEGSLRRAAAPLERLGEARTVAPLLAARTDQASIAALESALVDAGAQRETVATIVGRLSGASQADRAIALRTLEEAMGDLEERARLASIDLLDGGTGGADIRPVLILAEQSVRVAPRLSPSERDAVLGRAERRVDDALTRATADQRLLRARAEILEASGPGRDADAQQAWSRLADADPCSISLQRRLAESAARAGDRETERRALSRMLELDAALRLDPRRRLTPEERAEVERQLGQH